MKLALSHFLNSKHNIKKSTVKKKERNRMVLALKKKKGQWNRNTAHK